MLDELQNYVICTPQPFVLDLPKCHGMHLVTVDGQELFDWTGYFGSKLVGHNHPRLREPEYIEKLIVAANNKTPNPDFLTQDCLDYYRLLHRLAPKLMHQQGRVEVYSVNSGAEAVENMLKYLIAKHNAKRQRANQMVGPRRFLYFDKAFHGRTIFALGVTQTIDPVATKDFAGLSAGNIKLPFPTFIAENSHQENLESASKALNQVAAILEQMSDEIVGIIVEPIQGAGGHRVALPEFFRGLSDLAHRHDVYLAFDEVQTGLGATGKMWALDHFDLPYAPMAVATGKKFGNGAVYMLEPLDDIGVLDSTWGGTLADMVRLVQEIKIVDDENLIEAAAHKGKRLAEGLQRLANKHDTLWNVRGLGLYQGVSVDHPERKARLIEVARDEFNLLLLGAGNRTIRLRPNLSVTEGEIDEFLDIFDHAVHAVS
jgi:L-lysine 6-transaminase